MSSSEAHPDVSLPQGTNSFPTLNPEQPHLALNAEESIAQSTFDSTVSETIVQQPPAIVASPALPPDAQTQVNSTTLLDEFHFFPKLPSELRLKVWQYTANFPRVIELDSVEDYIGQTTWPTIDWPSTVRVAPNSRSHPTILHTCMEARHEALRYYELENFENTEATDGVQYNHFIYYNRQVDIVYFGEQSRIVTLDAVLRLKIEIPNVAIPYDKTWARMAPRIECKILHLLHGFDYEDSQYGYPNPPVAGRNGGLAGLQNIFFVIPWNFRPRGGNNEPVQLSVATTNDVVDFGQELEDLGHNWLPPPGSQFPSLTEITSFNQGGSFRNLTRWTGAAKPYFWFASLDTDHNIGRFYYEIELEMKGAMVETIEHKNFAVIRDIMAKTGCSIQVDFIHCDNRRYRLRSNPLVSIRREFRDITLFGTSDEVASAALALEGLRVTEEEEEEMDEEMDKDPQE